MSTGPWIVVAEIGDWRRVTLGPDLRRLLVFDEQENARRFAEGLATAGVGAATVGDVDGGDEAIAEVLDRHNAEPPYSFEIELASDFEDDDPGDVARAFGIVLGGHMLAAFGMANPN